MKKGKFLTIIISLVGIAAAIYIFSFPKQIYIEITNQEHRSKYIAVLKKQSIPFTEETDDLKRNWIIVKGLSSEELKRKMEEYHSWERKMYKKQGVVVNGS